MANDLQSSPTAGYRQANAFAALVIDEGFGLDRQLLQHVGHRCRSDIEASGEFRSADPASFIAAQREDGLQVIVDRLGISFPMFVSLHRLLACFQRLY